MPSCPRSWLLARARFAIPMRNGSPGSLITHRLSWSYRAIGVRIPAGPAEETQSSGADYIKDLAKLDLPDRDRSWAPDGRQSGRYPASANFPWRDSKFESCLLQRGVCELSGPCGASNFRFGSPAARRPLARSVQPESNMRPGSTPRVLPAHTDLGFAPLSTTSRFARTKADRWSFVTRPERGGYSVESQPRGTAALGSAAALPTFGGSGAGSSR